jgi:hypothetical protein
MGDRYCSRLGSLRSRAISSSKVFKSSKLRSARDSASPSRCFMSYSRALSCLAPPLIGCDHHQCVNQRTPCAPHERCQDQQQQQPRNVEEAIEEASDPDEHGDRLEDANCDFVGVDRQRRISSGVKSIPTAGNAKWGLLKATWAPDSSQADSPATRPGGESLSTFPNYPTAWPSACGR